MNYGHSKYYGHFTCKFINCISVIGYELSAVFYNDTTMT